MHTSSSPTTSVVNPWPRLPHHAPFVLPEDRAAVERFNATAPEQYRLRLDLPPVPFLGRRDAPVVLLNLNPGFDGRDQECQGTPYFAEASRRCQAHEATQYPFYFLDPAIEGRPDGPGSTWWRRKLKGLKAAGGYDDAQLAQGLLCVEYLPYRSKEFRALPEVLPSQAYGFQLVREAIGRGALIVVMRAQKRWLEAVPELRTYERVLRVSNWRAPALHRFAGDSEAGLREMRRALDTVTVPSARQ